MARSGIDASYKVVLTGQFGVGKSAIFRRFVSDSFTDDDEQQQQQHDVIEQSSDNNNKVLCRSITTTVPAPDNYNRQFITNTHRTVQLELWDTAGMERFCTMSGNYYANASAVLIVYAQDSQNSFNEAVECVLEAIEAAGSRRLAVPCGLVVFLCANKSDLEQPINPTGPTTTRDSQWVSDESVKKLVQQFDEIICGKYRISCRTGSGVESMFEDIVEVLDSRAQDKAERTSRIILATNGKHQEDTSNGRTESRACQCN